MNLKFARALILTSVAGALLSTPGWSQEIVLSDNFDDGVLSPNWGFDDRPFETGTIDVGGGIIDGAMLIQVTPLSDFWGGFALKTERTFAASEANPLTFETTRVFDNGVGITRSGVWITNSDRSQYVFFTQNIGEGGWQYNRRIGQEGDNPTGAGINIDAFDSLDEDFDSHVMRLVANGSTVSLFLDDQLGAEVDFPLTEGIVFAFGSYARSVEDDAAAAFDDVEVRSDLPTGLPCVTLSAASTALFAGEDGQATLSAPRLYVSENPATVTITSSDPEIATLEGANAQGVLTVNFTAGGDASKPLKIVAGKGGSATFDVAVSDPLCAGGPLTVSVSSAFIRNPSFEDSEVPEYPGYGEIAEWTGGSGINDGGPFGDNGTIPDRNQIAFSQGGRELTQEISGLDPSKLYHLHFFYNARQCCGGTIGLSVFFNDQQIGQTLENVQPVGDTRPYLSFSGIFQPASSSGTLSLVTAAEGDATLVFDAVNLTERSIDDVPLTNPSFEASGRAPDPGYLTKIGGWTGEGQFGVNIAGAGPFADNGAAPDQDLVAFLQGPGSSLAQTLNTFVVGETYTLTVAVNARGGNAPVLKVSLDDEVLGEEAVTPVGDANPYEVRSYEFTATSVTHRLAFEQTAEGDQTVLLDNIRLLGEASNVPCVPVMPETFAASIGQTGEAVIIEMPEEALADGPITITVSNSNPAAFALTGADANGSVQLEFAAGGELRQTVSYEALARGSATFALSSSKALCFENSAVTANALAATVRNPGFESNYPETWPHYGSIDGWKALSVGGVGTNLADGPFHDNGLIPDGAQIGFAQGSNELSQLVGGLETDATHWLQFHYNVRNCCGGTIGLEVTYGDQVLFLEEGPITAVGAGEPYYFVNLPFVPEAAAGILKFRGIAEGDATFLLDGVQIVKRDANDILVVNPSFEATGGLNLPAPGYLGTVDAETSYLLSGWEATGNYGINSSGNGAFADNGMNPDQEDVVFLQGAGSAIRQTIGGLTAGETYTLTYAYNARSGNTPTLQVEIDGNLAQETTVFPVGGTQPYHQHSFSFQASADTAELVFTQTGVGDQTVLIDDVRIAPGGQAVPCVTVTPGSAILTAGENGEITVRMPAEAVAGGVSVDVIFASDRPDVAQLEGSVDGELTLTFTENDPLTRSVALVTGVPGTATLEVTAGDGVCLSRESVIVTVNELVIPKNFISNGSFESNSHPDFPGYGPVNGWVKEGTGNSGINGADGPFHNNGLIPDRNQVMLMQNSLTLTQQLVGLEAGSQYWLQFFYNSREDFDLPDLIARIDGQEIVVLEDIVAVGGDAPYHFINAPFIPQNGIVSLQFESFVELGGDGTVLIDGVTVTQRDPGEVVVINPSFEASGLAPVPGYLQPAPIAGWTIEGGGYGTNRSGEGPFADNGTNPDQDLVLFLQNLTQATQIVQGLTAGQTYTLRFGYNGRGGNAPQLVVAVDGAAIFDEVVASVGGEAPYHQGEVTFTATADTAVITFGQVADGDQTILLDDIHVITGTPGGVVDLPLPAVATAVNGAVEISWPNAFPDLTLEQSTDLQSWVASAEPITDRDGRFVVTVMPDESGRFYRLRKP